MANPAKTVCAVIAEYNPFHNGHAYQLKKAREKSGAHYMAVMMSGCFTQRGESTLFSPFARAEMALRCGADIVFSSPVSVSVREADTYALQNVQLLNRLHYITHLAFGAECGELALLDEIARILETPNEDLDKAYKRHLDTHACSHAEALTRALNETYGVPADIVSQPNNILAISYLRALRKTKSRLIPVAVQRLKSYHDKEVFFDFPSATSLRAAIRRGKQIVFARPAAFRLFRAGKRLRQQAADHAQDRRAPLLAGKPNARPVSAQIAHEARRRARADAPLRINRPSFRCFQRNIRISLCRRAHIAKELHHLPVS